MSSTDKPEEPYTPTNALHQGVICGGMGIGAGFFAAAMRNALETRNVGAFGALRNNGNFLLLSALGPALYGFTESATGNLRGKDDAFNTVLGAFLGGSMVGLYQKSITRMLASGGFLAVVMGALAYTGGRLTGWEEDPYEDELDRLENLKKRRRMPIEETLRDVGEGRGIYPPGYQERRRKRLLEKYNFEVKPVSATTDGAM